MEINRYLTQNIIADLAKKMVFVGGPRQVGKTTLAAKLIAPLFKSSAYLNWDSRSDRKKIIAGELPGTAELIIYDEIHKYSKWKAFLKGEWDTHKESRKYLVTGSARLNIYRKGGDSLLGRYHYYTLHPFSLAEILKRKNAIEIFQPLPIDDRGYHQELLGLDRFGGFPAIFVAQNDRTLRRWHNERHDRLFKEDIRDLEPVRDIGNLQLLGAMLPGKVGSLLSLNAIREDLQVSHRAITHWMNILEQFYYLFRIYPWQQKEIRALKKEAKLYLFDWSEVEDEAARFENLIASHLLKLVHYLLEYEGYRAGLHFLRTPDKKEIDFLVTVDNKPWFAVEVKLNETEPSPALRYFGDRLKIPFLFQVCKKENIDLIRNDIRILSADRLLAALI
jgi:uncharacterized protein